MVRRFSRNFSFVPTGYLRFMKCGKRGFTLVELMVVVTIIAILAVGVVPRFARSQSTAGERLAVAQSLALDAAKIEYMTSTGDSAIEAWLNAANDDARYALIRTYLHDPNAAPSLSAYAPRGYTFAFSGSSLSEPTRVLANGVVIHPTS